MQAIDLGMLADGPHADLIRYMAESCAADERVLATWVGGSLAWGGGDEHSDVDFRVAVAAGTVEEWANPDWSRYLPSEPAGVIQLRFGPGMLLHHMVLPDGAIVDFLVLDPDAEMKEPAIVVLSCEEPALRARIEQFATPAASLVKPVDPSAVRAMLIDYWIITHKEMKALARKLDESSFVGLYIECMTLLRAWFIESTDTDIEARMSLHMLGALHKGIEGKLSQQQRAIVGMPSRTPVELVAAVDAIRAEMARVGRVLANRYGFEYPSAMEEVAQRTWNARKMALSMR